MDFIILLVFLLIILIINKKVKDRVSRLIIFIYISYWCISLLLCYYNPYGLYRVNNSTYFILIIHLFAFLIGFIIVKPGKLNYQRVNLDITKLLQNWIFIALFLSCFIFSVTFLIKQREALAYYSVSEIRGDITELLLEGNTGLNSFYGLVVTPMFHFCLCLASYMIFFYRRWMIIICLVIFASSFALLTGGRNQFMTFIYYVIGIYIIANLIRSALNGKDTIFIFGKNLKIYSVFFVIICIAGMTSLTQLRKNIDDPVEAMESLGQSFVDYSTASFVALDYAFKNENVYFKKCYYGIATFSGSEKVFSRFFSRFTGSKSESISESTSGYIQNNRISIGPDRDWNYAYTSCIYYYWDFGLLGIIIYPFILGFAVRRIIRFLYSGVNIYSIAAFTFCTFCMYMSVFSGVLHKRFVLLYFAILLLLSYKTKIPKLNKEIINIQK